MKHILSRIIIEEHFDHVKKDNSISKKNVFWVVKVRGKTWQTSTRVDSKKEFLKFLKDEYMIGIPNRRRRMR